MSNESSRCLYFRSSDTIRDGSISQEESKVVVSLGFLRIFSILKSQKQFTHAGAYQCFTSRNFNIS